MNPVLMASLIQNVMVPLIASIVRAHVNASGGKLPTDADVIAALGADTTNFANIGVAFLQSKGVAQ